MSTRWLIGAAAMVAAAQAGAQATISPIRPGEVALHIVASGETTSRADRITVPVTVTGRGATQAEARASAAAMAAQAQAALITAGIDRTAITSKTPLGGESIGFSPANLVAMATGGGRSPSRTDVVTMQVVVPDRAGLDRVTQTLASQDQVKIGTPVPSLRDDAPARRTAVAAAVGRARHDADDYAAALGMRVVRVTAASNSAGLADGVETLVQSFRDIGNKDKAPDAVITRATSVVDFVIAPAS